MKTVAIFMLLAIANQLTHAVSINYDKGDLVSAFASRAVGDKIKQVLEKLKETMRNGDQSKGIPKMEPLNWKHQNISLDDEMLVADGEVNDLHVVGLSNFNVPHADFKIAKKNLSLELFWPNIKGNTGFNLTAKIMDYIPIFGNGTATFEVTDFSFGINIIVKLDLKNKKIVIIDTKNTKVSLGELKLNAKGLYNNDEFSEFMSAVISDIAPQALVDFKDILNSRIHKIILDLGNEMLKNIDFDDIWGMIKP